MDLHPQSADGFHPRFDREFQRQAFSQRKKL
ncbi:unknown protein [Simkania negevensis Z]|uniref:Uncharacterized protein n=1 Tax=Simkania negevensis (strain ATCC VR-1471 / DSM 27360 / Z) TaxID=331113 RepID=F8L8F3_SIMNZ|nr:unknown protein [Simkania negevensis Z]